MTTGWLFDAYPRQGKMVCWIWQGDGVVRLEDIWSPSIYAAADDRAADLEAILGNNEIMRFLYKITSSPRGGKRKITDLEKSTVLKLKIMPDLAKMAAVARRIERLGRFGRYRLYNVDVPFAQPYFYQKDLCSPWRIVACTPAGLAASLEARRKRRSVWLTDYKVPEFKNVRLEAKIRKQGGLPRFTDR